MEARNRSTASARRPDQTSSISALKAVSGCSPCPCTGGSNTVSFSMASPLAAACRASSAPEENPYTSADPPAWSITAARSSASRSTAYGPVSPLRPRPRRS
jgi:hypothetical protein